MRKVIKIIASIALVASVFTIGFFVGKNQVICPVCKPENVDFSLFWDAYNKLHEKFINADSINQQKIIYGAIEGMAKSLGDPYTDFFEPAKAKSFNQDLSGSFEGIGVEIGLKKGQLTVVSPLKGSPGERAGLQPGDVIVRINGNDSEDISIDDAVSLIRGRRGTSVTLTILREGWDGARDFNIIRERIKIDPVHWEMKEGDIAHINIRQFDQSLPAEFRKTASQIMTSGAKRIIVDVRNNPGGYLEVAQYVAGWFLKNGSVVTTEAGRSGSQVYKAEGNGALTNYPAVVLINKGSASASEILAGALRDNRGIKLIGEKSFGKGSVQEAIHLADGVSLIKITVAKWLTPKGSSIADVGLAPDIKVGRSDDEEKDPQLEKAIEIVKGLK